MSIRELVLKVRSLALTEDLTDNFESECLDLSSYITSIFYLIKNNYKGEDYKVWHVLNDHHNFICLLILRHAMYHQHLIMIIFFISIHLLFFLFFPNGLMLMCMDFQ